MDFEAQSQKGFTSILDMSISDASVIAPTLRNDSSSESSDSEDGHLSKRKDTIDLVRQFSNWEMSQNTSF